MPLTPGTRLGSYEIVSLLGAGGMGEVYKAKDLKLGRDVAIKVLREGLASDPERLRRFEQEARAASSLNHPNIITIYDIGEHEGTRYIAMEYVEGKTLREMLGGEPLPTKKLIKLSTQIADGLAKAHTAGIVHRDLKPENLMVTSEGFVKILDFGLAKLMPQSTDADSEMDTVTKATQQGVLLGTLQYMSPEQAASRPIDYRSDQFSFGSILYEMATGRTAFKKDTMPQTLAAIIQDEPEPLITLNEKVPAHFPAIVERCLAKLPEERYDSTRDLARELRSVQEVPSVRRSRRAFLMATTGLLAAFVALAVGLNVGGLRQRLLGGATAPAKPSVAVLPFQNLSPDAENEYFSDGMTEEIISKLSRIQNLQVASRTSVTRFKSTKLDVKDVGEELGVRYLLEGSVRKAGNRVRITAQLIDASTGFHLWSDVFDGDLEDVFGMQEATALKIAEELDLQLSPEETEALHWRYTQNPEAYDAYLRGWALIEAFHGPVDDAEEKLTPAREHFEKALGLDADYPLALAGMSLVESLNYALVESNPDDLQRAEELARQALEIDPQLPESYIALALVHFYRGDPVSGANELREALRLEPNNGYTWCELAANLNEQEPPKPYEAEEAAREGIRLQPSWFFGHDQLGFALELQERFQEAILAYQHALELNPHFKAGHVSLGRMHVAERNYAQALAEFKKAEQMEADAWSIGLDAGRLIVRISAAHAALGDTEKALAELERAHASGYRDTTVIQADPHLASMRDDPRFQDLVRRMNFPDP